MIIAAKRQKFNQTVMIFGYVLSIFKNIMDSSDIFSGFGNITNFFLSLFLLCVAYKLLTQKYNFLSIAFIAIMGAICIYSTISMKSYTLFYSYIFICAMQDVDLDEMLKIGAFVKIILIAVHVGLYIIMSALIPDVIQIYYRNGVERQSFFMGHPNMFTAYLAWTCLEIIYVFRNVIKGWHLFLIWIINMIFFYFTDSNTGTIVISVVIILFYVEKRQFKIFNNVLKSCSKYGFLCFTGIFTFLAMVYPSLSGIFKTLWIQFNDQLTGRLLYGAYAYDNYGFTFFGRNIVFPDKSLWRGQWLDKIYFDNSYFEFLFLSGALYLIIISIALIYISKMTTNIEKIFIIALIFYAVMERYTTNIFICFPFLLVGKYIYEEKNKRKKSKTNMEGALWKRK